MTQDPHVSSVAVLLDIDFGTGIATITLNRPKALNALNRELSGALQDVVGQVERDARVRAVVIQGAGNHFMTGGDIKSFHSTLQVSESERRIFFERFIGEVHDMITRLRCMEKPVLASVRGAVAGFGLSLMYCCDLAIAADDAYFTLAYRNIRASPDGSGNYGLPKIVDTKRAMEIALLGERFGAQRAFELGLVNQVVPAAALVDATRSMLLRFATGPTRALGRMKRLINDSLGQRPSNQLLAKQDAPPTKISCGGQAFLGTCDPTFIGT